MRTSRRQFLAIAGGAVVLAACGDDAREDATPFNVFQRFPNTPLFTPGGVRLPVSLGVDGSLLTGGPDTLTGWIEDFNGARVAEVSARSRSKGIEIPYWAFRVTLPKAVIYTLRIEGDDGFGATFEVFDPADVRSPLTGSKLPPFDTPTVDDHRGVEPYCSLTPSPCPLHEVTLTDALAAGKPLAYIVGTPAHCQTGTCAPGLELLVAEHAARGSSMVMVHADVYADDAATTVAPAVEALNVDYEPIVYLCAGDGTIVDRLDGLWDATELKERLDALAALS